MSTLELPPLTALNGSLIRHSDGWSWVDGSREPKVRDMTLRDVAPNFRCTKASGVTYVEIPHDWDASRHWPNGQVDEEARRAIASMLSDGSAEASPVYAEGWPS